MPTTQQTFDAQVVLQQMSTEEILADWRVFLTSRTKLIIALILMETLESFRLTRWFMRLSFTVSLLELPVVPFVIALVADSLYRQPLQVLFLHLIQAPYHANTTELLIVSLLSLLCALTIVRLVCIWREYSNTAHTTQEEAQE